MHKSLLAFAFLVALAMPFTAQAAVELNGISSNDIKWNGLQLNDIKWNGAKLNGWSLNGLKWNGLTLNGKAFNGWSLNGAGFNGTGAWLAAPIAAETGSWSAIANDQVRVRLPLAR